MEVQSLAMLANMLANKFNVEVRAVGDEAYCTRENGITKITVPSFVADTDAARVYARGYIDHEIGRARFTDWAVMEAIAKGSPLQRIADILEDAFVDRMMGKCYPGCAINLANMKKQLFVKDKIVENIRQPISGDGVILWHFFRYLLYRAQDVPEMIPCAEEGLENVMPGMPARLDALLRERLPKCKSTADNIQLARDIRGLFSSDAKEQAMQDEADAADKNSAANCMNGDSGQCSDDARQLVDDWLSEMSEALQKGVNMSNVEAKCSSAEVRGGTGCDLRDSQHAVSSVPTYIKTMAMGSATALSAQLQSLMQAKVLRRRRLGLQGKLDTNRLHRVILNNPVVFLRNSEIRKVNTQVILLSDMSGSMNCVKDLASAALYAVMAALRNMHGIESAAYGFGDEAFATMCAFNTPLYQAKMHIERPSGGTPGGTALQRTLQKFDLTKPELRKLLFFITDGEFPHEEVMTFKAAYRDAKEAGIDVIGIGVGIGTDAVYKLWNTGDFFIVKSIRELAPKLFELLKARLV